MLTADCPVHLYRVCHQVAEAMVSICQLASGTLTCVSLDQAASLLHAYYLNYADVLSGALIRFELL